MYKNKQGINVWEAKDGIKGNKAIIRPRVNGKEYEQGSVKTFTVTENTETQSYNRLNDDPAIEEGPSTYEGSFTDYWGSPIWLTAYREFKQKNGYAPDTDIIVDYVDTKTGRGRASYIVRGVKITSMPVIQVDVDSTKLEGSYSFVAEAVETVNGSGFKYTTGERR